MAGLCLCVNLGQFSCKGPNPTLGLDTLDFILSEPVLTSVNSDMKTAELIAVQF